MHRISLPEVDASYSVKLTRGQSDIGGAGRHSESEDDHDSDIDEEVVSE